MREGKSKRAIATERETKHRDERARGGGRERGFRERQGLVVAGVHDMFGTLPDHRISEDPEGRMPLWA